MKYNIKNGGTALDYKGGKAVISATKELKKLKQDVVLKSVENDVTKHAAEGEVEDFKSTCNEN